MYLLYYCPLFMALNSLECAGVPLRNYSLTLRRRPGQQTIDSAVVLPVNYRGLSWGEVDCWADCRPDTGGAESVEVR